MDALKICRRLVRWVDGWVGGIFVVDMSCTLYSTVLRKRGLDYRWRPTRSEFERESQTASVRYPIHPQTVFCCPFAPARRDYPWFASSSNRSDNSLGRICPYMYRCTSVGCIRRI